MVYVRIPFLRNRYPINTSQCGKPSKCCSQCRKRDIKSPSCGQCLRASIICPGYPNPLALVFRDETKHVVSRSRPVALPRPLSPLLLELPAVEAHAKNLFVFRYIEPQTSMFPYMREFWPPTPEVLPLGVAIRAVSLAYLSYTLQHQDAKVLRRARQRYGSALALLNTALRQPDRVRHNSTLMTVLLLDQFEKFTSAVPRERVSSKHMAGAIALVKLCGLRDETRARMFHHLSLEILAECVRSGEEVPEELLSLHRKVGRRGWSWHVEDVVMRFLKLRGAAKRGEMSDGMRAELMELEAVLEERRVRRGADED